jgi:hypothetical protein
MGDGDFAGESADSGGTAGFGGAIGDAGAPDAGGTAAGGAGAGNTAAGGGAGGATGTGGSTAGAGGASAGSGGATQATGCAKLTIPFDATTDKAHFVITLPSPIDMSAAVISTRLLVTAGVGGVIHNYVQDSGTYHFLGVPAAQRTKLSSLTAWSMLTWNVGTEPEAGTGIVKTSIKNIGIEVNASPSTVWANPTIIFVDSITVSTPTVTSTFTFDASGSVYTTPSTTNVSGQALWINAGSTDTTAAGTAVAWQATCP